MTRTFKPRRMWMMRGINGHLAPFYGCAFTQKQLLQDIRVRGLAANHCTPVAVIVTIPEKKP